MELHALGSGNAFTRKNWQSNFIIKQNGKRLLIDCGSFAPLALTSMGLSETDIGAVYISHIHADHVGGLEALAFTTFFNPNADRPKIFIQGQYFIQKDNKAFASGLAADLWDDSLQGGLRGLETEDAQLHTYFDVHPIQENSYFMWEGIKFDMVQTVHVSARYKIEHSYGLMWNDPDTNERIYITTDTQFCPVNSMTAYLNECDVIFHDCETGMFPSNVHAHYNSLRELPDNIKSKIWLYHYHDNVIDDWDKWCIKAENDGFRGFVKTGAMFDDNYIDDKLGTVGK